MTQWRIISVGLGGVVFTGLDYSAVEVVIRRAGFKGKRAAEIFEDIQTMENAALEVLKARTSK